MKFDTLWTNRDGGFDRWLGRATAWTLASAAAAILASTAGPARAFAEEGAGEVRQDRAEIAKDKADLRNDVKDVRRLERLLLRLDSAHRAGDREAEERIQKRIFGFLRGETAEARRDLAGDRKELAESRQEVRSDRRDVAGDKEQLEHAKTEGNPEEVKEARRDLVQDRRDLKDDRGDRRDDRRDLAASRRRLDRQRDILVELRKMEPDLSRGDSAALSHERELFDEFLKISREDAAATGRELREDRRDLREDRQDRRSDHQESGETH